MSDIENAEENATSSEHAMTGDYCTLNISIVSTYPAVHKRARCGECAGCTVSSCKYCRDSRKFGGPGKLKKACTQRICTNMQPPSSKIKQVSQPVKSSKFI